MKKSLILFLLIFAFSLSVKAQETPTTLELCARAADEVKASRILIAELESQIKLEKERADLEKQRADFYRDSLIERKSEAKELREVIDLKNKEIALLDARIKKLEKKKAGKVQKILSVLAGIGIGVLLR